MSLMAAPLSHQLAARAAGNPAALRVNVVQGASSATALTLSGIRPGDKLLSVLDFHPPTDVASAEIGSTDHVAYTAIGQDTITIGGTISTSGEEVLVFWYKFT